ncbi:MAG: hypothetical protein ACK6BG_15005 [Cyanobacteriota bacterium]
MLLPNPFCPLACPLNAARVAGLRATVRLRLTLLIKARVQIKEASAVGFALLALQTLGFLEAAGGLGLLALGGAAVALNRRPAQPA